jgi:RNA polymerase sigma factor for flagellar operon FliA
MDKTPDIQTPGPAEECHDVVAQAMHSVARRLPRHVSREDICSAGRLAFVQCVQGGRALSRPEMFVRVRGAMLDELRACDPLTRGQRNIINTVRKAAAAFETKHGRTPLIPEIAALTSLSGRAVSAAMQSLEAQTEPSAFVLPDELADGYALPFEIAENGDAAAAIIHALLDLPEKQAAAVRLCIMEEMNLAEAAEQLDVSGERVRQLREAGLKRLRENPVLQSLAAK